MNIRKEAKKDALRYAKAKMNYGDGAGIARRHINAELEKKFDDAKYQAAFEEELAKLDMEQIVREIKTKNNTKDFVVGAKKTFKTLAKVGTVAAAGYAFYDNNREGINRIAIGIKIRAQNAINKWKYRKHTKIATMSDAQKAEAYLKSVGIDWHYDE